MIILLWFLYRIRREKSIFASNLVNIGSDKVEKKQNDITIVCALIK